MSFCILRGIASVVALVAVVGVAGAQSLGTHVTGNSISAAGETADERAPIFSSAAFVAPAGAKGLGLQAFTDRFSFPVDESGIDMKAAVSVLQIGGYFGVTSAVTVGAYLPFITTSVKITGAGPFNMDESESGLGDIGVLGRFAAFRSQSGMTRFSVGGEVTLATGDEDKGLSAGDATFRVEGTLSHRMDRWNFHATPGVVMIKAADPFINFDIAGVYSVNERLGLSLEALVVTGGKLKDLPGDEGRSETDLGAGIRYRLTGGSAVDVGLRYNVSTKMDDPKPTTMALYAGWHVRF